MKWGPDYIYVLFSNLSFNIEIENSFVYLFRKLMCFFVSENNVNDCTAMMAISWLD